MDLLTCKILQIFLASTALTETSEQKKKKTAINSKVGLHYGYDIRLQMEYDMIMSLKDHNNMNSEH